ncbi:hypothetical protein Tco_0082355, partial [Tanacetum coccineum]
METARSQIEAKLQEGRLSEPTKAEAKAGQIHPPHKNTKRNPGFRQREVQASSANDNPGRKKKRQQILRVSWGKLKQSSGKDQAKAAKRGKPQERKNHWQYDGTTMAEGIQTKDYSNFLSGISNILSALRGGGWDG